MIKYIEIIRAYGSIARSNDTKMFILNNHPKRINVFQDNKLRFT